MYKKIYILEYIQAAKFSLFLWAESWEDDASFNTCLFRFSPIFTNPSDICDSGHKGLIYIVHIVRCCCKEIPNVEVLRFL